MSQSGEMSDMRIVVTTTGSEDQASRLAGIVVAERLAACVQTMTIASTYRWEGSVVTEPEVLLLCKTTAAAASALAARLEVEHDYDVPEVIVVPVEWAAPAYRGWLQANVSIG